VEREAYTIPQFLEYFAGGLSRSGFYGLQKLDQGPRLMRVGGRVMVSRQAAEAWVKERELATPNPEGRGGDRRRKESAAA
jgi:hypothetical protein